MRETATGNIISNWQDHYSKLFSKQSLHLKHTLHKSELFTDAGLAKLLDNVDRDDYHVNTRAVGPDGHKRRREGEFGDLNGKQLLDAVKKGDIWINLQAPQKADKRYGEMLQQMYGEFENRVPGFETFKHGMTILISSPKMVVPFHADVPGQMLWQVRGKKRVWVYPFGDPFLSDNAVEKLVLGELHEVDMPYHDWFDKNAEVYDLEPGYMLHWPLNYPHRVENYDCLNVSITTEHYTKPVRNAYAVNYANGLLRKIGFSNLQRQTGGIGMLAKMGLAGAVKFSGIRNKAKKPYSIDFRVNPKSPNCVENIKPYELNK